MIYLQKFNIIYSRFSFSKRVPYPQNIYGLAIPVFSLLSLSLSLSLSFSLSLSLTLSLSLSLSLSLTLSLSTYISISISIYLSMSIYIYQYIHICISLDKRYVVFCCFFYISILSLPKPCQIHFLPTTFLKDHFPSTQRK